MARVFFPRKISRPQKDYLRSGNICARELLFAFGVAVGITIKSVRSAACLRLLWEPFGLGFGAPLFISGCVKFSEAGSLKLKGTWGHISLLVDVNKLFIRKN